MAEVSKWVKETYTHVYQVAKHILRVSLFLIDIDYPQCNTSTHAKNRNTKLGIPGI